MKSVAQIQHTC